MDTTKVKAHLDRIGWAEDVPPGVFDAIRELIDVVERQQSEIAALKSQVARLESRIGPAAADESDSVSCALKQIAEMTVFSGNSLKIARINRARSILPLGLIDAKRFVEANFADNGRGKVIVRN